MKKGSYRHAPNASITEYEWQNCLDYFGHRCAYCGRPAGLWLRLSMDHFVPASLKGSHDKDNIVVACHGAGGCNGLKSDSEPEEWVTKTFGKRKGKQILDRIQLYFDSLQDSSKEQARKEPMQRIQVMINHDQYQEFKALANRRGLAATTYARVLIAEYLEKHEDDDNAKRGPKRRE